MIGEKIHSFVRQGATCQATLQTRHAAATDTVYYFAYGANMASSTLIRRDIKPLSACPAKLPPHQSIAFRHRGGYATITDTSAPNTAGSAIIPWLNPSAYAAVSDAAGFTSRAVVGGGLRDRCIVYNGPHGVLYELHRADLRKLASRETGYALGSIEIFPYAGERMVAFLFMSQALLLLPVSMPPQRRYLELMLEGAKMHGLAPEYIQWLESLPWARPGGLGAEYFDTPSELLARSAVLTVLALASYYMFYAAVH